MTAQQNRHFLHFSSTYNTETTDLIFSTKDLMDQKNKLKRWNKGTIKSVTQKHSSAIQEKETLY